MANTIQVLRKDLIAQLSSIKHDNIGIADVVIDRTKLLQALKLQTQANADVVTINYGMLSWHYDYKMEAVTRYEPRLAISKTDCDWVREPYDKKPEPCIQFSCDHTIMRFTNRPKLKNGQVEPKVKHLNFIDADHPATKTDLTGILLDTQALLKALTFVMPCVASEQARPALNCILLDCGNDTMKLVAADGFRLGIASIPATGIQDENIVVYPDELVTFLKSIKPIGKGKAKYYPRVYMTPDYKTVKFSYLGGSIELPKQKYTFPAYEHLIPKDGTHIQFIASQVLKATKAIAPVAKDGSGIIRLQFKTFDTSGKVILSAKSEESGDTAAECDANVEVDCKIAVNASYLIDLLKQCGDDIIDMRLTHHSSPMVFSIGNDRQSVIMPMFVQW